MTILHLHHARTRRAPRPVYYDRREDSVPLGAFCFLAMIGLLMWVGIIKGVMWLVGA